MTSLGAAVRAVAGYKQKDWFVADGDRVVAGPLRTLWDARMEVYRRGGGFPPLNHLDTSFYSVVCYPSGAVYYLGLGGAMFDQGIMDGLP